MFVQWKGAYEIDRDTVPSFAGDWEWVKRTRRF